MNQGNDALDSIEERFFDFDRVRLRCVAFGGIGRPALLLHGLYGRAKEWHGTARWLSASHEVYALDQRGHGASSKGLADFSRSAQVDDAIRTIEGIDRGPVLLVGQSMGGVTAFLAAARRPDLVSKLVVIEALTRSDSTTPAPAVDWLSRWPLPFRTSNDAREFFRSQGLNGDVWVDVLVETADGFRPEFRAEDMAAASEDLKGYDYSAEWNAIVCPTLVVGGSTSWLSQQAMREMAKATSHARYVCIDGAGHDVHLEAPESLRGVVEAFVDGSVLTGLSVRPATVVERGALEALQRRASLVWEEYRELLLAHPDAIELPASQIVDGRTLVAEFDGKTVGFAVVLPRDDGDAELDGLFVEPEMWRKGIGTRLVAEAEDLAAREGAQSLYVIANPLAEGFYSACCFSLIGEEATRFGVALRMRKAIMK